MRVARSCCWPSYRPERLLDALARVEGIQQVEWEH
jgi:hypothetical protein